MVQSFQWQFVSMKSASSLQSPTDSGEFCFISCFILDGLRECVIGTLVSASALILSQGSWFAWICNKKESMFQDIKLFNFAILRSADLSILTSVLIMPISWAVSG